MSENFNILNVFQPPPQKKKEEEGVPPPPTHTKGVVGGGGVGVKQELASNFGLLLRLLNAQIM